MSVSNKESRNAGSPLAHVLDSFFPDLKIPVTPVRLLPFSLVIFSKSVISVSSVVYMP
jgi:hypothetical protein